MQASKRFCSVPQCTTYGGTGCSLHFFPIKDKNLCLKWKIALKIGKPITKYMMVCSKHFLESDYYPITPETRRRCLKKIVVPSQNLPVGSHDVKKIKKRKSERFHREQLLSRDGETCMNFDDAIEVNNEFIMIPENQNSSIIIPSSSSASTKTYVDRGTQTEDWNNTLPDILNHDEKLKAFTNVDFQLLETLHQCCKNVASENALNIGDMRIKIILVLVKLKLNLPFLCLAILFNISSTTCTRYFYSFVSLLATAIKPTIYWPSKEENLSNMPTCFQSFKKTCIVLDCTEIPVDKCKCLHCRIVTYSHYKGRHTIKFLIGITPSGLIAFLSSGHGGRASDKAIFNKEKLVEKVEVGDAIMVDKGFLIEKECEENLITLIRPPFLRKCKQFSKADAEKTALIARARVHVERAIQRIKMYRITSDQISWYLIPYINDIMTIVVGLVNLSPPILAEDKFTHDI